jgi:hypothetical protein
MSSHCGICFGQGHTEEHCDTNPMHAFGHGRGDHHVQAMPIKVINPGDSTVEPTQPMEAVETLTMKDIVHRLIERNLQAWKALPEKVRDVMMEHPQDFQLIGNKNRKEGDFDYNILHNGTVWRYHATAVQWVLQDIVR